MRAACNPSLAPPQALAGTLRLRTVPFNERGCVRIEADRARRGGSGALHPQSALAGLNPLSRGPGPEVSASLLAVMARSRDDGDP